MGPERAVDLCEQHTGLVADRRIGSDCCGAIDAVALCCFGGQGLQGGDAGDVVGPVQPRWDAGLGQPTVAPAEQYEGTVDVNSIGQALVHDLDVPDDVGSLGQRPLSIEGSRHRGR